MDQAMMDEALKKLDAELVQLDGDPERVKRLAKSCALATKAMTAIPELVAEMHKERDTLPEIRTAIDAFAAAADEIVETWRAMSSMGRALYFELFPTLDDPAVCGPHAVALAARFRKDLEEAEAYIAQVRRELKNRGDS